MFVRSLLIAASICVLGGCTETTSTVKPTQFDPTQYVDPFIGTDGKGKTFPGATVPHGMVQLSPDNGRSGWDWIAGYFYPDNIIAGFSHTHLSGTGAGDLYDISFMPLTRPYERQVTEGGPEAGTIVSRFSHDNESASPGYYQVHLSDYDINVELTAGVRTGFQKYHYPDDHATGIVRLDLGYSRNWDSTINAHLVVIDDYTIAGYRKSTGWAKDQRVYFYTTFSHPFKTLSIFDGSEASMSEMSVFEAESVFTGKNLVGEFEFDLSDNREVTVRTALSSVSTQNAKANLNAEVPNRSFEQVKKLAQFQWREELSKVKVQASSDNLTQFYTAMYHASLAPRIYSDVNGQYKGPDGNNHTSTLKSGEVVPRYDFFSLWDTFRALHPWKTIIDEKRTTEMMHSIYSHYTVFGRLPVWIFQGNETDMMMGYHSVPVLVDAYLKGLLPIDGKALLAAAIDSATQKDFGIHSYQNKGYVPYEEKSWNVSLTLEYAYDDWAIAQLAKVLGEDDIYQTYLKRSQNYQHHFDPITGFMRAKSESGDFREPFIPTAYHPEDYCEANAWQYTFFVPQDIAGLIKLMGGEDEFSKKLDAMFTTEQAVDELPEWISGFIGQYVHGNEPSHHVPYLYNYVNQPHKTQALVRRIMDELYTTKPDGLAGNEDAGQMSAWYLFSALGFYPVDPVAGVYSLGSPEVDSATIMLENGSTFSIKTKNQSSTHVYVKQVTLNGKVISDFSLKHSEILAGGELVFTMSETPYDAQ
ncbi:GH92 family glycosyl hydrolase [Marinibactrum halimedae]|uniref:Alpha-1 2-mannosidase n=1 Tax=Marinibactrum halimedae TaxID=1444977 RepID=A0AA37WLF5_9GAMM|nr:GH92 family glycosyl hydrolase [Marinibactrum halimedae]MCD9460702.1 GH92 family glycosyl hydrolase [Marinibactrum halimedae]GLS25175.1 alpha-1 2-mannosidase [Marinibactrum halimedae]